LRGVWRSTLHTAYSRAIQPREHAHGLLDEHDQAFVASRVLSSLPDGGRLRLLPLRSLTVHAVLVRAAKSGQHQSVHVQPCDLMACDSGSSETESASTTDHEPGSRPLKLELPAGSRQERLGMQLLLQIRSHISASRPHRHPGIVISHTG
jgi:hypothetical protein